MKYDTQVKLWDYEFGPDSKGSYNRGLNAATPIAARQSRQEMRNEKDGGYDIFFQIAAILDRSNNFFYKTAVIKKKTAAIWKYFFKSRQFKIAAIKKYKKIAAI